VIVGYSLVTPVMPKTTARGAINSNIKLYKLEYYNMGHTYTANTD